MTISMGVALGPCSLPHTLEPSFVLEDNEMEIGLGIHGEAGVRKVLYNQLMKSLLN